MSKDLFADVKFDDDVEEVIVEDVIVDSEGVLEPFPTKRAKLKTGEIQCKECGKIYKSITGNHLSSHNMTLREYANKWPGAEINYFGNRFPDSKELPNYIFKKGLKQNKEDEEFAVTPKSIGDLLPPASERNLTTIESYVRKAIGENGESVIKFLHKVILYNQKRSKDKLPLYKPSEQIKAADMLLSYGFGRPTQRQDINKNVKQVTINVSAKMPEDLDPEDF